MEENDDDDADGGSDTKDSGNVYVPLKERRRQQVSSL